VWPSVSLALVILAVGCGGGSTRADTTFTILATNANVGRAVFHLGCGPATGDVPEPNRTCSAIARDPSLLTRPRPFTCIGGPSSWRDLTISGRLHGHELRTKVSTCWTPQMRLIGVLGIGQAISSHLQLRRKEALRSGQQRTFPPGHLRAADLVVCTSHGQQLNDGVPTQPGRSESSLGGSATPTASLTVVLRRDGSVRAACK
jgi:hypothetical protein